MGFLQRRRADISLVTDGLANPPARQRDSETEKRIEALRTLLNADPGTDFKGKRCHQCGDAFIAVEAPVTHTIVTKNGKHLEPIARMLGKQVSIAILAKSTKSPASAP